VLLIYKEIKYKFKILNFNKKITNLKLKQWQFNLNLIDKEKMMTDFM
jgi:hypothetical protein